MDENLLLKKLLPKLALTPGVAVGPGDDCAVMDAGASGGILQLLAADQLIENVHYLPSEDPEAAGRKLAKRNLSDIAAMGGVPAWGMLCIASERGRSGEWLLDFAGAVSDELMRYRCPLVGGDVAGLPAGKNGFVSSLAIGGTVERERMLLRKNAVPGDSLWVSGLLGNSFKSRWHLEFVPRLKEGRFLAENGFSRAAMDISDGLLLDLRRMLTASGAAAEINLDSLPLREGADIESALSEGEDYELLFTVPQELTEKFAASWPEELTPVHCIGRIIDGTAGTVYDKKDKKIELKKEGFSHGGA